jgi:predicted O-methyltransferase YrrM
VPNGGANIIETGAGNSTIAFLAAGAGTVTSIAPDADLFARIREYCVQNSINVEALREQVAISEESLPQLLTRMEGDGERADVALIDGGHGWPTVFVDFCYLFRSLRKGGVLIVDDIHIYSIKELARFLSEDPNVRLTEVLPKTLIFEKIVDRRYLPDFGGQPYIRRKMEAEKQAGLAFKL